MYDFDQILVFNNSCNPQIPLFQKFVSENNDILKRCIVFVEETSYGEEVLEIIHY